ncbi:lachesin [Nephila pilipes]|uniref:Lachesin n=1 Tax=Nephila pilipes TaxID=299642 RepID=A0A8X6PQF9_NEPPI|nr:lachesin [Nephila pilipes]
MNALKFLTNVILVALSYDSVFAQQNPSISYITKEKYANIGDTIDLHCSVHYASIYPVLWVKIDDKGQHSIISSGSSQIIPDQRYSIRHDEASSTYTLQITKIQQVDTGLYQCQVIIASASKLTEDAWVYVRIPPVILDNSTQTVQTTSGAKVFLQCYATGYPEPKVSWRRENNDILPTGGVVYRGNILAIHNISKHDRGTYYCIADNGVGKGARRHVGVEVEFAPVVYVPKTRYKQALGYDMDLYCQIEAYPEPSILWLKDQQQIFDNQREHFITTFSSESGFLETKLRVAEIEDDDYGVYTCKAINKLGHDQKYITLEESYTIECPPVCGLIGSSSIFHYCPLLVITLSSIHDKIYLGSTVRISCFGKKFLPKRLKAFSWEHLKSPVLNDNRHHINEHGVLTITDVSIDDTGIFFCIGNSTSGARKVKHVIEVLQIPSTNLRIIFVYSVKHCKKENEELANRFVERKLRGGVCSNGECEISLVYSNCRIRPLPIPSLRVTVSITLPAIPNGNCDVDCTRKKMTDVKDKVMKEVVRIVMKGDSLKLPGEREDLAISYYDSKEDLMCDPGFEMKNLASRPLCVPCKPGYYLNNGYCIPCRFDQYSERFAQTECRPCGEKKETSRRATRSKNDCHIAAPLFFGTLIGILLPVLFIIVLLCWLLRRYARGSAVQFYFDKWCLCLRKKNTEGDLLTQTDSETETETEHDSKHQSIVAISGPHRYWDKYAHVLGKESEKKAERKKQTQTKRHEGTERKKHSDSKRNEGKERKKRTDPKRNEIHGRKKSIDRKRSDVKEKKRSHDKKSRIPTPPALPTKSMIKQATRDAAGYDKSPRKRYH